MHSRFRRPHADRGAVSGRRPHNAPRPIYFIFHYDLGRLTAMLESMRMRTLLAQC